MAIELIVTGPDGTDKRVEMDSEVLILGRSHSNDLCFPEDASLSRKHLKFTVDGAGLWAEDLGSKNGSLLNGVRLTARKRVHPGDRLSAGQLAISLGGAGDSGSGNEVFFTPEDGGGMEPSSTLMTSLEGLISSDTTLHRSASTPRDRPGTADSQRAVFDSPIVKAMFRAMRELVAHRPLEELFPLILELSIDAVGAERGVLMTLEGGGLVSRATHGEGFRISTTVRDRVLNDKSSILVKDMDQEKAFREQHSISVQNIHTMMAVPLQTESRVIGLIYVDSRLFVRQFSQDDLSLLTVLANVAAIRIEQERFAKMEQENQQAAKIQRGILPGAAPKIQGLELAGHNAPCLTVGGDYYDYLTYEDGRLGVVLGDVAGKGMSAALLMSNLQARVQILGENPGDLAGFMARLDRSISAQCPTNRFITFFFGMMDPQTGRLSYCNAGHNPPLVIRKNGDVERLETSGTVLGMLPELGYRDHEIQLAIGDTLAVFSDGVTEATAAGGDEEFGEERLAEAIRACRTESAASIVEAALDRVAEWTNSAPAEDDVTLVVLRRIA